MGIHQTIPALEDVLDFGTLHIEFGQAAHDTYIEKFGVNYHDDPQWQVGNERHLFWVNIWDSLWNPDTTPSF